MFLFSPLFSFLSFFSQPQHTGGPLEVSKRKPVTHLVYALTALWALQSLFTFYGTAVVVAAKPALCWPSASDAARDARVGKGMVSVTWLYMVSSSLFAFFSPPPPDPPLSPQKLSTTNTGDDAGLPLALRARHGQPHAGHGGRRRLGEVLLGRRQAAGGLARPRAASPGPGLGAPARRARAPWPVRRRGPGALGRGGRARADGGGAAEPAQEVCGGAARGEGARDCENSDDEGSSSSSSDGDDDEGGIDPPTAVGFDCNPAAAGGGEAMESEAQKRAEAQIARRWSESVSTLFKRAKSGAASAAASAANAVTAAAAAVAPDATAADLTTQRESDRVFFGMAGEAGAAAAALARKNAAAAAAGVRPVPPAPWNEGEPFPIDRRLSVTYPTIVTPPVSGFCFLFPPHREGKRRKSFTKAKNSLPPPPSLSAFQTLPSKSFTKAKNPPPPPPPLSLLSKPFDPNNRRSSRNSKERTRRLPQPQPQPQTQPQPPPPPRSPRPSPRRAKPLTSSAAGGTASLTTSSSRPLTTPGSRARFTG